MEKWPCLDQNRGLTPLEKCQFFEFLNFFFYSLERRFFVLEYLKRHFPGLYFLKNIQIIQNIIQKAIFSFLVCQKSTHGKKFDFCYKNHGLTPLENFDFLGFLKLPFCVLKYILFYPKYIKKTVFSDFCFVFFLTGLPISFSTISTSMAVRFH